MIYEFNAAEIADELVVISFRGSNVYQYWLVRHIDTLGDIPNMGFTNAGNDKSRASHCTDNIPPVTPAVRNGHHCTFIDKQLGKWLSDKIGSTNDGSFHPLEQGIETISIEQHQYAMRSAGNKTVPAERHIDSGKYITA